MKMNRVLFLLLLSVFVLPMVGFGQSINMEPVRWEKGTEIFLPGCLPGKGDYKLLQPSIYAVLDSGLVGLDPADVEIHLTAQNDGTPQSAKYQPSQLVGINYRARVLRAKTIATYFKSKGYKVVVETAAMSVPEKGALYRGAWIRVEDRFDVKSRIQVLEVDNHLLTQSLNGVNNDLDNLKKQVQQLTQQVNDLRDVKLASVQNKWQAYGLYASHSYVGVGLMVKFPSGWILNGEYSKVNWNIHYEQAWNLKLGHQLQFLSKKFGELYATTGLGSGEQLDGNWTSSWGSTGLLYDFYMSSGIHFLAGIDVQYKFKHQKAKVGPLEFYETKNGFGYSQKVLRPEIKENKYDGRVWFGISIELN